MMGGFGGGTPAKSGDGRKFSTGVYETSGMEMNELRQSSLR